MPKVGIIDCCVSNLTSVKNAFKHLGTETTICRTSVDLESASHLVLPGVGAFPRAMQNLRLSGLEETIHRQVEKGKPLLGLCLGMQLLADEGEEFGMTKGLGLIPGRVTRLTVPEPLRLPHVGWNDVSQLTRSALFDGVENPAAFYFVHSFGFTQVAREHVAGECEYGVSVVCVVQRGHVMGAQFHPEKSQKNGLQLLRNFVAFSC